MYEHIICVSPAQRGRQSWLDPHQVGRTGGQSSQAEPAGSHTTGEGQDAQQLSHAWTHPGEGTAEPPGTKGPRGRRHCQTDAHDTGWARQMLPMAPKTLCSSEGTRTARQPTRKDCLVIRSEKRPEDGLFRTLLAMRRPLDLYIVSSL